MNLNIFNQHSLLEASRKFFEELNIPLHSYADEALTAQDALPEKYKDREPFTLIEEIYVTGMVDDAAFADKEGAKHDELTKDYEGILILTANLKQRENNLLPTRSQLAEISRAFNQDFKYVPVVVLFKYHLNDVQYLAFANTERLTYKQQWREGEKAGKVSILRDIDINNPHRGHIDLLNQLVISTSGKNKVDSFNELYKFWQKTFDVSLLNKKFYKELANWYFWAIKHVKFPSEPTVEDAAKAKKDYNSMVQQHNAKNAIRLLTRLLFSWFMKEKKLIPEELFDLKSLQKDILNEINPYHGEGELFHLATHESIYYKAILQNLFFASLNCPIEPEGEDKRKRGFRGGGYGTHRGIDYLMRYKKYFKNSDAFLELMNKTVPFLNGGLFECLDDKFNHVYVDGFSDQMTKGEKLVVPDYLFFGVEEKIDLSDDYGIKNKGTKQAAVKGLINLLDSYKFTITENTPIEEDVALDPELLGKVFENLLASYNPETKTTARKQTGSFYTPREIVNYMVDESLIAYLKNAVEWEEDDEKVDEKLHQLASFDDFNPFDDDSDKQEELVFALDRCKILDPACGSGAFPMGALQKMVHMLQKLDSENKIWKEAQRRKVMEETEEAFDIEDKQEREQKLIEINNAFDERINNPDYARKLYLLENSIYGVDIQPIATQISKLRFFISLVVDQKSNDKPEDNFNIQPLPNLETRFVAANTLIGIEKPDNQGSLFDTKEIQELENELKKIRHKLFSARTKETKLKYRKRDKELRHRIAQTLKENGWPSEAAEKLAGWDPYDQNASSSFFDPEWMFDIKNGYNLVIGNPPYIGEKGHKETFRQLSKSNIAKRFYKRKIDIFYLFFHISLDFLSEKGIFTFITTNYYPTADAAINLRVDLKERASIIKLINFNETVIFESAKGQHNLITIAIKSAEKGIADITFCKGKELISLKEVVNILSGKSEKANYHSLNHKEIFDGDSAFIRFEKGSVVDILNRVYGSAKPLKNYFNVNQGILTGADKITNKHITNGFTSNANKGKGIYVLSNEEVEKLRLNQKEKKLLKKFFKNSDIDRYWSNNKNEFNLIYLTRDLNIDDYPNIKKHVENYETVINNRSQERGEMKAAIKLGKWWVIFAARDKSIFEGEKIISPQRSYLNTFAYNTSEWFSSADVYYITKKNSDSFSLKYLLGVLNSALYYQWLYRKGKRKGEMLELYATPLENIPIKKGDVSLYSSIILLVNFLIYKSDKARNAQFQKIIDALVFQLFFECHMQERGIDVLENVVRDIKEVWSHYLVMKYEDEEAFEKLPDAQKEEIIKALHQKWSDPQNEVVKRMAQFKEKSPDILKVIMES